MSASVVSPEHIKELVTHAVGKRNGSMRVDPRYLKYHISETLGEQLQEAHTDKDIATIYAGVLYSENLRSVAYKYDGCKTIQELPGLIEKPEYIEITTSDLVYRKVRNPVHIIKMCHCLDYQSCETDNWEQTDAYQILQSIIDSATRELPGYEDAPWEYSIEKVTA